MRPRAPPRVSPSNGAPPGAFAGGEASLPVAASAICAWQLAIALAEELYYRGFIESAGVLALSWPLRGADAGLPLLAFVEGLPMLVSAAVFGLVHAEFVQEDAPGAADANADGVVDTKGYWFRVTALYSLLYSALYVATGHRLLAPTCAHAGLNRRSNTPKRRLTAIASACEWFMQWCSSVAAATPAPPPNCVSVRNRRATTTQNCFAETALLGVPCRPRRRGPHVAAALVLRSRSRGHSRD